MTNDRARVLPSLVELTGGQRLRPEIPHSARVYDYWLGGKDNFAADRELANRIQQEVPTVPRMARANREFMHRATRYLVGEAPPSFSNDLAVLGVDEELDAVRRSGLHAKAYVVEHGNRAYVFVARECRRGGLRRQRRAAGGAGRISADFGVDRVIGDRRTGGSSGPCARGTDRHPGEVSPAPRAAPWARHLRGTTAAGRGRVQAERVGELLPRPGSSNCSSGRWPTARRSSTTWRGW
jgi:hypothetical protein